MLCINTYVVKENILPHEQKGCTRRAKGARDQLLIDPMVMSEAKKRHKNLQMLWVDYKKHMTLSHTGGFWSA